ncbi:hypothetical protein V1506DRAFT_165316 [Lipomyces tetrasporus]
MIVICVGLLVYFVLVLCLAPSIRRRVAWQNIKGGVCPRLSARKKISTSSVYVTTLFALPGADAPTKLALSLPCLVLLIIQKFL